ncbi:efflux RND transporter periplasmic adaptor subunit [bacterium]|nr:efflux RND transporter periplasmic adaptor subunit [bacterium]
MSNSMQPKMKLLDSNAAPLFRLGMLIVVMLMAGCAGQPSVGDESEKDNLPNSDVVLQQVGVMPLIAQDESFTPLRYTATVVARRTSQLAFQASERVDELLVDEGDRVTAGQLLARQDDTVIVAQHDAAVASMNQAAAVLAELKQGPRRETIRAARAELDRLEAQANLAKTTLKRQTRLMESSAGSQQEYDAASAAQNAMRATVQSAQQRLEEMETGTRQEKIQAQQAAYEMTVAAVKQTQARLDQTRMLAPFSGRISQRYIDEGSLPQRGSPAFEIMEVDHLEIRFGVSSNVAKQLKPGQSLPYTLSNENFNATVRQIQPSLDRATRTQEVIVDVDPKDTANLVDGQTVRIEFAIPTSEPGMWLPTEALQRQVRGLWSVLVLETEGGNEIVARRDVELLATWGQWSRVRGTLMQEDRLIVSGSSRVSAGQRVEATPIEMTPPWQRGALKLTDRRSK